MVETENAGKDKGEESIMKISTLAGKKVTVKETILIAEWRDTDFPVFISTQKNLTWIALAMDRVATSRAKLFAGRPLVTTL